jgi:hypothetical protein
MSHPNDIPSKEPWTDMVIDEINYLATEWVVPITGNPTTIYEIGAIKHLKTFGWALVLHLQRRGIIEIK